MTKRTYMTALLGAALIGGVYSTAYADGTRASALGERSANYHSSNLYKMDFGQENNTLGEYTPLTEDKKPETSDKAMVGCADSFLNCG